MKLKVLKPKCYTNGNGNSEIRINTRKHFKIGTGEGRGFVSVELENIEKYRCYISPYIDINEFEEILEKLENDFKTCPKDFLIAVDFNAKKDINWDSNVKDKRGEILMNLWHR
ncbi:hypothetical protein WA026_009182 [Henosepilachna vigintioctopunctata]|uniref:Endonuclease/exonuclease/phosphatase domain-containing protein n=1 Tax=Henosepilachna vigintioctopunctata TaxID=420089 RepID=A0AAW1UVU3_9CUCU